MRQTSLILIVDDTSLSRRTMELLLQAEGYRLEFAITGAEALSAAVELRPDLILLDVVLPDMDGFEVCQRLRMDPRLAEVPIIFITALEDYEARMRGFEVGADDVLVKPFNPNELQMRIRTILRLNRYRRILTERQRFEWVVEYADDGYLMLSDDAIIFYANPQARRYLGLALGEEALAGMFPSVVADQYRLEPREAWEHWPNPPGVVRYLVRPESAVTHELWLQVDVLDLPVSSDGGSLVRLRDVTAQLALQRDAWKFHSVIYHKLRTPLAGVKGAIEVLATRAPSMSTQQITTIAERSRVEIQRLHDNIEEILLYLSTPDFVRYGGGFRLVQLPDLVAQLSDNLQLASVEVINTLADSADVRLGISPRAMELVLGELLQNAQKFHPSFSPRIEVIASEYTSGMLTIHVRDDGLTLSPSQLSSAAIPYYQGEKYQTGEVKGMGLGLAMVTTMICGIGGSVQIYNREIGPGVVVELTIPRSDRG